MRLSGPTGRPGARRSSAASRPVPALTSAAVLVRMALAGLFVCAFLAAPAAARLPEPVERVPDRELFFVPLNGNLGSPFGYRWGRMHEGIDIEGCAHTDVHAALAGTITRVGWLTNAS